MSGICYYGGAVSVGMAAKQKDTYAASTLNLLIQAAGNCSHLTVLPMDSVVHVPLPLTRYMWSD